MRANCSSVLACMETLSSEIPTKGQNPSGVNFLDHCEHIVAQSLACLGLSDNEDEDANTTTNLNIIEKKRSQQSSVNQTPWLPGKDSASNHQGIWGYRYFTYGGDGRDKYWFPDIYIALEYSPPSTTSNLVNNGQLSRDLLNYQFDEPYPGFKFDQDWSKAITEALGYAADFMHIQYILSGELCLQKVNLIHALQSFVFTLMTDEHMFCIFTALVDACNGIYLDSLVGTILLGSEFFINAAFCEQGVKSIVKLITKVKKSRHAFTLTGILSAKFFDIMTDHTARRVFQQCFILFGHEPNKILYDRTIYHWWELATHKVGCKSLNECINTIAGEQRSRLLSCIADASVYLSIDPYGNYVVQNLLDLHDSMARILSVLRGHHIKLAQHKVGSNVVERCMECSEIGLIDVVNEILVCPTTPLVLTQDDFGNYVIQKALRKTRELGFREMHKLLVKSLKRYHKELNRTRGGKNVIELMEEQRCEIMQTHSSRNII